MQLGERHRVSQNLNCSAAVARKRLPKKFSHVIYSMVLEPRPPIIKPQKSSATVPVLAAVPRFRRENSHHYY